MLDCLWIRLEDFLDHTHHMFSQPSAILEYYAFWAQIERPHFVQSSRIVLAELPRSSLLRCQEKLPVNLQVEDGGTIRYSFPKVAVKRTVRLKIKTRYRTDACPWRGLLAGLCVSGDKSIYAPLLVF